MAMLGRVIVLAGIVTGLLAVSLPYADGARYVDDGTTAAFLIVLLALTSWMPAEVGRDAIGAVAGSVAFGFFLFLPAIAAFDDLGRLDAGAWLGLCVVLIPAGALVTSRVDEQIRIERDLGLLTATAGLVLVAAGIWLDASGDGPSYWNLSSSGHAVGLLMLVLVAGTALLVGAAAHVRPRLGYPAVLAGAITFGFVEFGLVATAFGDFGSLGAGGWVEAVGGILLLGGIVVPQLVRPAAASLATAPA